MHAVIHYYSGVRLRGQSFFGKSDSKAVFRQTPLCRYMPQCSPNRSLYSSSVKRHLVANILLQAGVRLVVRNYKIMYANNYKTKFAVFLGGRKEVQKISGKI